MKSDTGRHNISIMHTGLAARIFHAVARDEGERERERERERLNDDALAWCRPCHREGW